MDTKIHIVDSGPPLTIEQIAAFEKELGGRFPEDYKRFLLKHNGGRCEPLIGVPFAGSLQIIPAFGVLYPSGEEWGMRNGLRHLRNVNPTKTDGYLPIVSTTSECEVCLKYRGTNAGAIYFTAYKYRKLEHPNEDLIPVDVTMVPVADSFSEFLDYVVVIPDIACPIVDLAKQGTEDDLERYLAEGYSLNALSKNGLTLLCEAIKYNNTAIINACIQRGASLSGSVRIAVINQRPDLIEMLVKAGADVNERDECGGTPLEYVGGTALPGEQGARNRDLRALLIKLGAIE